MFTVSEVPVISSASISSAAACLLLQAAALPMISPLDVHMLIERELTKTNDSTSAGTATIQAANVARCDFPADDKVSLSSPVSADDVKIGTTSKSDASKDCQSVPVSSREICTDFNSDNCDLGRSVKNTPDYWLQKPQTDHNSMACSAKHLITDEEQKFSCELDPVTSMKSDGLITNCDTFPSSHFVAQPTSYTDGHIELPCRSAAALAELCKNRLSSSEINNNYRHGSGKLEKIGSDITVGREATVRKSKRCNRGRRYHELMSQGILQHHTWRKRSESLSL